MMLDSTPAELRAERADARHAAAEARAMARARWAVGAAAARARHRGTCTPCIVGAVDEPCSCSHADDHGPGYAELDADR